MGEHPRHATSDQIQRLDFEEARRRSEDVGIPGFMAELNVFRTLFHNPGVAAAVKGMLNQLLWKGTLDAHLLPSLEVPLEDGVEPWPSDGFTPDDPTEET